MMKKDGISDHEILTLIHKNIDMEELKDQDKTITKKRIDQFFQKLKEYVKKDDLSISDKAGKDVSTINKRFDFLIVNVDGASKGNPGEAGIGVAVFDKDLKSVKIAAVDPSNSALQRYARERFGGGVLFFRANSSFRSDCAETCFS